MANFFRSIFGGKSSATTTIDIEEDPNRVRPIYVSDDDFDEVILRSDKLALVDLWAEWCGPCHMLAPTIEDIAAEYGDRVLVAKLDVDENPISASKFNIMGIPTVLFIKDGREVDRVVGVQGYTAFANRIERLLEAEAV